MLLMKWLVVSSSCPRSHTRTNTVKPRPTLASFNKAT
ncbi:hypothetical protein GPNADHDJ_04245 [Stenotrophomonas maltophilia]|uniref:Uncharacterized protein n=1 Tax=Stenotrophomonas maltophilia TaxID=40324 RepID=A0AAX1IIB2_STEMA|nr:hypothetical protein GPNADHDJ_04245 [Stenotrophomonas maltophilia]